MDSKKFTEEICKALLSKKAQDVLSIDVRGKTEVSDYFVVAGGRSMAHTKSLAEFLEEEMENVCEISPTRREGVREGRWAVLDYGDVIVHIFNDESRLFYHLENLWGDEKNVTRYED